MDSIVLEGGKYYVTQRATGEMYATRYGEVWRELSGDKLVGAMFDRIRTLEAELTEAREELAELNSTADKLRRVYRLLEGLDP